MKMKGTMKKNSYLHVFTILFNYFMTLLCHDSITNSIKKSMIL